MVEELPLRRPETAAAVVGKAPLRRVRSTWEAQDKSPSPAGAERSRYWERSCWWAPRWRRAEGSLQCLTESLYG